MFNFLFFILGCVFLSSFWLCSSIENRLVCFGFSFNSLMFQVVSIKFESRFQKTVGLSYSGRWFCGVSKLRSIV